MGRRRPRKKVEEPANFWHSFLFKFASRMFLGLAVIVVFLTLTQCTVKKPEAPEWNTTFVVPVVNKTYDMEELIRRIDQEEIFIDTNGDVAFSMDKELDTVQLNDDDLSVSDLSHTMAEVLGPLSIDAPDDENFIASLESLAEGLGQVPGWDSVIIPANTPFTAMHSISVASFTWADITQGQIKVVVSNWLGLTLYGVGIELFDAADSTVIANCSFPAPLAHGDADSVNVSLAGKRVSNDLRLSVSGHSNPLTEVRLVPEGKQLMTSLSFGSGLVVSAAMAEIPDVDDLNFSEMVGLDVDASESIDSAGLQTGDLDLAVTNNTSLPGNLMITIPNLHLDGMPLSYIRDVGAGQTVFIHTDLAGYTLVPENDSVEVIALASIPGSGSQQVLVRQTDSVDVDVSLSNMSFGYVTGIFANSVADFDDIHEELDVPEGFDNISLVTAILTLEVENAVDMPGYLDIEISGSNGKVISLSGDIEAKGDETSQISTIVNDEIADFLSPLPEAIDVSGTVQFGDGAYHGTVTADDFVLARVRIDAPLAIKVTNAEVTDLDIEAEDIDQDDMDYITDHVISARFIYTVANHLPLGVTAVVHLSNDSASLFETPLLTLDTLLAQPAPVSIATGIATAEAVTAGEIHLENEDVQILNNDSLYIRQQLFLNASDTSGVQLTENDYITINGRIEVVYRFDGDF
ncbi:MAG: hypothetical protein JSW34_11345 [Candidatus Zixiibacteriota bacterium]|nr:MAG: hypothetical protein JSW34_11345 [candidate division Zixibacteria bacterium]